MLSCLKSLPPPPTNNCFSFSSPASQGYSVETTPRSSVQLSPTINLTQEYALAVQTTSYGEIKTVLQEQQDISFSDIEHEDIISDQPPQMSEHVLQPSHDCVQETLSLMEPNPLTHLVSTYFQHSEHTSHLCFLRYRSIRLAGHMYNPIHNLLDNLPPDFDSDSYSLSDSQCESAYNIFLQFDRFENPFLSPNSETFNDMRRSFSELREKLGHRRPGAKAPSRYYRLTGPALCLAAAAVGVVLSVVAVATHGVVALVGSPVLLAVVPFNTDGRREKKARLAQLDSASMNAYALQKDLDTNDRLVAHLHADVENDKDLVRLGLGRGMDGYLIQEILKQLRRNRPSFVERLECLEDHLVGSFAAINRSRSRLLQEIHQQQNPE